MALVAEPGPESVIPLHRSAASLALLAGTANALGVTGSRRGGSPIHITNNFTVNGGGSDVAQQVQQAMSRSARDLVEQLRKAEAEACIPATSSNTFRMLNILTVANPSASGGSSIEVQLFHYLKDAKPDIGKEYDLGSIGEVLAVHGPYEDPPKWMVSYKGRVSAKEGDWIEPKD